MAKHLATPKGSSHTVTVGEAVHTRQGMPRQGSVAPSLHYTTRLRLPPSSYLIGGEKRDGRGDGTSSFVVVAH
jgi:hypothetical protein